MANLSNINNVLRVSSNLRVGINTDAASYALEIGGTNSGIKLKNSGASGRVYSLLSDTSGNFQIYDDAAASGRLVISSGGNVGIGTSSPTVNKLQVEGSTDGLGIAIKNTGTGGRTYGIQSTGGTSGYGQGKLAFVDEAVGARMVIDNSGNVGIGITTPTLVAGKIVHIHGTAAGVHLTDTASGTASSDGGYVAFDNPNLYIQNKEAGSMFFETSGTTKLTIDSSGNATFAGKIIGQDDDSVQLELKRTSSGTDGNTSIKFVQPLGDGYLGVNSSGSLSFGTHANLVVDNKFVVDRSGNATFAGNVNISSAGDLYINSGTSYNNKGSIFMSNQRTEIVSDIVNLTANGDTSLNFKTRSGGATASALFIDEFRRIGIGATSPSDYYADKLVVKLNSSENGITIVANSNTDNNYIMFADGTTGNDRFRGQIGYNHQTNFMAFAVNASNKMYIKNEGNVGIGTDSPNNFTNQTSLTVSGTSIGRVDVQVTAGGGGGIYGSSSQMKMFSNYGMNLALESGTGGITTFATNTAERMRIDSSGNVLIGTSSIAPATQDGFVLYPQGTLHLTRVDDYVLYLNRRGSDGVLARMVNDGVVVGGISVTGTSTTYNTSSDYRLKEDLQDFNGLDKISKIPVYDFKWKVDESRSYGVLAHELQEVIPDAVGGEKDAVNEDESINPQGVDYSKIVPLLVKAIQELEAEIELLKNK
jgi:hypothetical protein